MRAKSIRGQSQAEIVTALRQATADGFAPTLGIVFASIHHDIVALSKLLEVHGISMFGASSAGEFINGELGVQSIVMMLMDLDPAAFRILIADSTDSDTRSTAREMAANGLETFSRPSFIVSGSGLTVDGEMIIRGIEDAVGEDAEIWGGMAGDDLTGHGSLVFTNGKVSQRGIVMLVLDQRLVTVFGRASSGWRGVGTAKTVTDSDGMWVHTIDDKPALDQLTKFLGFDFDSETDVIQLINHSAMNSFLLLKEKGAPVVRSTIAVDMDRGAIKVTANVEPGSRIRIAMPPDFDVVEHVIQDFDVVKQDGFPDADALIMFSCSGRLYHLGPLISKEIEGLIETYRSPLAGFFTYGEFGRAVDGDNEFHNFTCCWLGLKERNLLPADES
ncbi:MAG: FIST N-terminal domain-containing protein [Saprospiraceae bacterium]|nr:FIST N-terminal domain-containing protein [Saprospiraceae bacterium]